MSRATYFAASCFIAIPVLAAYFLLQGLLAKVNGALEVTSNLDPVVLHCLPESLDEESVFSLVNVDDQLKLKCVKQRTTDFAQPFKKPSVRFVVALGESK